MVRLINFFLRPSVFLTNFILKQWFLNMTPLGHGRWHLLPKWKHRHHSQPSTSNLSHEKYELRLSRGMASWKLSPSLKIHRCHSSHEKDGSRRSRRRSRRLIGMLIQRKLVIHDLHHEVCCHLDFGCSFLDTLFVQLGVTSAKRAREGGSNNGGENHCLKAFFVGHDSPAFHFKSRDIQEGQIGAGKLNFDAVLPFSIALFFFRCLYSACIMLYLT